ncbi:MAG: DUF2480 family protein [Flavobacteriales bacterium]|nr:DUF2480 family protein [Flavobacteriales bacterium]
MSDEIVNKVAQSGIITLDLASFRPEGARVTIDIADHLWQGIALKEKDFRDWIKSVDWSSYQGKHVAIFCSADAVIPSWAYMLLSSHLSPFAATIHYGDESSLEEILFRNSIMEMNFEKYTDERIMLKGCGDSVPMGSYVYLTNALTPVVKSLMFGEPCSAVPVYKAKKKNQ